MENTQQPNQHGIRSRKFEAVAIFAFICVNLVAPLLTGELYPFTISPMFSDQPSAYCTYEVRDAAGQSLNAERFNLHMVYDGNPAGLGMGIVPTPTVHAFGEIGIQQQITKHVRSAMQREAIPGPVAVKQTIVRLDGTRLAETSETWTVELPNE